MILRRGAGKAFQQFRGIVNGIPIALEQAVAMETQWVKSLIKMGKIAWLSEQEASVKATMNKQALSIVLHAQTYFKYTNQGPENERHWMWKDAAVEETLSQFAAAKFSDIFADVVAASCIPVDLAAELGFALSPVLERFACVTKQMLKKILDDIETIRHGLAPLLAKFKSVVPGLAATAWDVEALKDLVGAPDVEQGCQKLQFGSLSECRQQLL